MGELFVYDSDESGNYTKEYLLPPQFSVQYFFLDNNLHFACRNSNDNFLNIARISLDTL